MNRINGFISTVNGILVLFLTGAAFVLSFHALADLALASGVAGNRAWLYPAIIDGAIIVFSLSVLRANLNGERAAYPWMLVGMFTILSVILNVVHAQASLLARFLAAIPPAALFLSFELFMTQVKALAKRLNAVQTLKVVQLAIQKERAELNALIQDQQLVMGKLDREIQILERKRQILVDEVEQMQNEQTAQSASKTAQLETARQTKYNQTCYAGFAPIIDKTCSGV